MNGYRFVFPIVAALLFSIPAYSWTRHVENNGLDSSSCGSEKDPCRSIGQAIRNSVDGDEILVGPGEYGRHESTSGPAAIVVDKRLTILSSGGAAATVINMRDTGESAVDIIASHTVFGRSGHGFTIIAHSGSPFSGIFTHDGSSDVIVAGNLIIGFGRGIDIAGDSGTFALNVATADGEGMNVHGTQNRVEANAANGNFAAGGMVLGGTEQNIQGNIVNANTFTGIRVASGANHRTEGNAVLGNGNEGISLDPGSEARITGNNLYGTVNNCGLKNNGNARIVATGNYWGAASGPGSPPASNVCNIDGATTNVGSFLRRPVDVRLRLELENEEK